MKKILIFSFLILFIAGAGAFSAYRIGVSFKHPYVGIVDEHLQNSSEYIQDKTFDAIDLSWQYVESFNDYVDAQLDTIAGFYDESKNYISSFYEDALEVFFAPIELIHNVVTDTYQNLVSLEFPEVKIPSLTLPNIALPHISFPTLPSFDTWFAEKRDFQTSPILKLAAISPAAGIDSPPSSFGPVEVQYVEEPKKIKERFPVEEETLTTEAILVANRSIVISSSLDGRIQNIPVKNGDRFKKGDVLIEYDCSALEAESKMVEIDEKLTDKQAEGNYKLFNLDLISKVEMEASRSQQKKIDAQKKLYQSRLSDCRIVAEFDGRVTNRLANPGEYTRTDRVLLEVASAELLNAEILIPSKWLRWVDVGAPVSIKINETMDVYDAKISRIYGEVDPVTQSIQVVASMAPYQDRLLPGMGGQVTFKVQDIKKAGIRGYLEKPIRKISTAR